VEVCHPSITEQYGLRFLDHASYLIGSPTALANEELEQRMRERVAKNSKGNSLYVPRGALWGANDIKNMAELGKLVALTITMKKHPSSMKLQSPLKEHLEALQKKRQESNEEGEDVVFSGSVRELCPLAPNNVNTMAVAALASSPSLGFDRVIARFVADTRLESHVVEVDVTGPGSPPFRVITQRINPAKIGAVTGNETLTSFLMSVKESLSSKLHNSVHFC